MRTLVWLLILMTLTGCTTVVVLPPPPSGPLRAVAIVDHGRHSSLVIEASDGTLIRYSYGDWRYYALSDTGILEGGAALLWPTQAGLGRQTLTGPATTETIKQQLTLSVETVFHFEIEAALADSLRDQLDTVFRSRISTRVYNPDFSMEFVHHQDPYWAFHNSNQMIALWLEILGCQVRGPAIFSRWRILDEIQ